jgi:hypothetical protein
MKKVIMVVLSVALIMSLAIVTWPAGASLPSAKATAQIAQLDVFSASATTGNDVDWDSSGVETILSQKIKTANMKDLFIDASLLSGLYTKTEVKSSNNVKDTSGAAAMVVLRVEVDGDAAFPGWIPYEARVQVLSAKLQGILNPDFTIADNETISLMIGTLSANSFNFIVPDLPAGEHEVVVKAACVTGAFSQQGSAAAVAVIGLGSVTIEEVRMVKGEDVILD